MLLQRLHTLARGVSGVRPATVRALVAMLERGVYLAPSAYEAGFVSSAHGAADLQATFAAAREAFARVRKG